MARNRKRAKERRPRRTPANGASQPGLPTATEPTFPPATEPTFEEEIGETNGVPDPIEHATPDVELADAQLAYGRPEEPEPEDEADDEEFELEVEESVAERGGRRGFGGGRRGQGSGGGELAAPGAAHPEVRENLLVRLVGFLQGSWRELQRVQWPDRRQVAQATGVVVGFVIVAAVFLGVADFLAGKLVTFVLK